MKKNLKLFFSSLINNNSCIDGARKKPWYAAIIIFLISIVLSVIPGVVMELRKQGDKYFESTTYMFREATTDFSKELQDSKYDGLMYVYEKDGSKFLAANESVHYENYYGEANTIRYIFQYCEKENLQAKYDEYVALNSSFVLFTRDTALVFIVDPNTPNGQKPKLYLNCIDAYKKLDENAFRAAYAPTPGNETETVNNTWNNWKLIVKNLYNQTRVKAALMQLAIISAVNAGIVLIMGFMLWILTRGKNNPYRLFTVWEAFKMAFWASISPALITVALGFLITNFAATMFPLLVGVRIMWMSMKSLRPDGSGYAAD